MKKLNYIKRFNESVEDKKVLLNDYIILEFISKSRGELKKILKLISKRLTQEYITLRHEDCENSIDGLKSLGFEVKIYDDSNEYSENFDDKVKISWECDFKNTIE